MTFLPYSLVSYTNNNYANDFKNHKLIIKNRFYINKIIVF